MRIMRYTLGAALMTLFVACGPNNVVAQVKLTVKGVQAKELTGAEAGLPKDALPGAKFITMKDYESLQARPKTGLFIIDLQYIPIGLPEQLKGGGLSLQQDGVLLDSRGQETVLFVTGKTFQIIRPKGTKKGNAGNLNFGEAAWERIRKYFARGLISTAEAATPFPWETITAIFPWSSNIEFFCRRLRAWTVSDTWGPIVPPATRERPHTRVANFETRATVSYGGRDFVDRDNCTNCDHLESYKYKTRECVVIPASSPWRSKHFLAASDPDGSFSFEQAIRHPW